MSGKPSASCVCTETPFFTTSPRVRAMTSRIAPLISKASFRGGAFLIRPRIRSMTSMVRLPCWTVAPSACRASSRFGGCAFSQFKAALALATVAAIGCMTSWAIEADSSPIVVTRLTCASCVCASRNASDASISWLVRSTTRCSSSSLSSLISALARLSAAVSTMSQFPCRLARTNWCVRTTSRIS